MTTLLFPDNTVLINFAYIDRMDLLGLVAREKGRWCATVAKECTESTKALGLQQLAEAHAIFGEPIYPETQAEHLEVRRFRAELATPGDDPGKHLGEAETLAILTCRRPQLCGAFVTDDAGAARLARVQRVEVYSTWHLLKILWRANKITEDEAITYLRLLRDMRRRLPPNVESTASFVFWLHQR